MVTETENNVCYPREIPAGGTLSITIDTIACDGTDKEITKLEHATLTVSFQHRRRGDVSVDLFSPSGTRNEMLSTRRYDDSKNGLHDWTFMTVHNWGENPKGVWVMNVTDNIATLNKGVDVNGYLQHDTSKQEADVEDLEEEVNVQFLIDQVHLRFFPSCFFFLPFTVRGMRF